MLSPVNQEDFRYSLIIAIFLHIVLFLVLFLSLRHSTKLLLLTPPSLQVIHATAISIMDTQVKKSAPIEEIKPFPVAAQTLPKPVLLEKSPVLLPFKEKKIHKAEQDKVAPLKAPNKQSPVVKKVLPVKTKPTKKIVTNPPKKVTHKPLKSSKESLKLVEKNVQELLDQEMKSIAKREINATRNAATTDKYRHLILQAIAQQWIIPPEMNKHLETKLAVHLAPGGMVLEVVIVKSSGNSVLDRSAQTAVYKASPLPVPKNSDLFHTFRQINLTVRPEGVMTQ